MPLLPLPDEDFYPYDVGDGWYVYRATCEQCAHQWVAVFPEDCTELECSQCGHMTSLGACLEYKHPEPSSN